MNFAEKITDPLSKSPDGGPKPPGGNDLPGGPMPEWHLYQQRDLTYADRSKRPLDYTDHLGNRHRMPPGAHLEAVKVPRGREVRIVHSFDLARDVAGKCLQKYEGKYPSGLFGVNVNLNMAEMDEIKGLLQESRETLQQSMGGDLATQMYWKKIIDGVESDLSRYSGKDQQGRSAAYGTSATAFGENLKKLTGLIAEVKRDNGTYAELIYSPSGREPKKSDLGPGITTEERSKIAADEQNRIQTLRDKLKSKEEAGGKGPGKEETGSMTTYYGEEVVDNVLQTGDRIIGASAQGGSHENNKIPRQDALWISQNKDELMMAAADGHGSKKCFRSHRGAKFSVEVSAMLLNELSTFQKTADAESFQNYVKNELPLRIVSEWKKKVDDDLRQQPFSDEELEKLKKSAGTAGFREIEKNPATAYGATLLTAAKIGDYAVFLKLGDGDILSVDSTGKVSEIMEKDDRLIANETTSLCLPDAHKEIQTVIRKLKPGEKMDVMISTDGVSNSYVDNESFHELAKGLSAASHEELHKNLTGWLKEMSRKGSGDDVTLGYMRL